jgi:hypothetical protein
MGRACFAAIVFLVSASAGAVEVSGRARGAISTGIDTNPTRDFYSPDSGPTADLVLQGIANLGGALQGERGFLSGSYDIGARKFLFISAADTIVQSAQLDGTLWVGRAFAFGITGRARDRRGDERDYSDLNAELNLQFAPERQLDFRVWGAAHRFIFWRGFDHSYYAPEGGVLATYRFGRQHTATFTGQISARTFDGYANANPMIMPPLQVDIRHDFFTLVSAAYWYRGPVVFSLSYGYLSSTSNSWGEAFDQHRIGMVFGAPLFWRLMFMLDINLRFTNYPNGIFIDPVILTLDENSENLTSIVVKLVRPFGDHFELEARYGFYYGALPQQQGWVYQRHVATFGISFHF